MKKLFLLLGLAVISTGLLTAQNSLTNEVNGIIETQTTIKSAITMQHSAQVVAASRSIVYFEDYFDSYTAGQSLCSQTTHWTTYDGEIGGDSDPIVSSAHSLSAPNSILVEDENDLVFVFDETKTNGKFIVEFDYYVPSTGDGGYFNVQKLIELDSWAYEVFFNNDGTGYYNAGSYSIEYPFTHVVDQWFHIINEIDLDNDLVVLTVNGIEAGSWPASYSAGSTTGAKSLGGFNFYGYGGFYYFDNFKVTEELYFDDNFDNYTTGQSLCSQTTNWTTYDGEIGGDSDPIVSSAHSLSAPNSILVEDENDLVFVFDETKTNGKFIVEFDYYIPSTGDGGYFNVQKLVELDSWAYEVFFNNDGTGYYNAGSYSIEYPFTHVVDQWFHIKNVIDLDHDLVVLTVNGIEAGSWPASYSAGSTTGAKSLGGFNFYGYGGFYYFDNFKVKAIPSIGDIPFSGGAGTESDPYIITTAQQLEQLGTFVNTLNPEYNDKYYKLGNDIDLSDYQTGLGWMPIGNFTSGTYYSFNGYFDGDNKKITGLYINNPNRLYAGLFGMTRFGTIENLFVENADVTAGAAVGLIVGYSEYGTIQNCHSTGTVTGTFGEAAGIAGDIDSCLVTHCYSSAQVQCLVSGYGGFAGGVVCFFQGQRGASMMSNCYFTGTVNGGDRVGGIAAQAQKQGSMIMDCYSTGNVTGDNYTGSLIGQLSNGPTVINCFATGNATGNNYVGALVGSTSNTTAIKNCYATGKASGVSGVGGILGYGSVSTTIPGCNVENCYSISEVIGTSGSIGGIAGGLFSGTLSNCAALNPSVKSPGTNVARVLGRIGDAMTEMSNNIAFEGLLNNAGNTTWENIGIDDRDGANISKEDIHADGTLGGRFITGNGWSVQNGKLPGLIGNVVDMPLHLQLEGLPYISTLSLPNGVTGIAYNATLTANGNTPITWSIATGDLPDGLALSATTGEISGTPTVAGTFNFTVMATNSLGNDTKALSILIFSDWTGSGTESDPYIIYTAQQLDQLSQYVDAVNPNFNDKHYRLGNDIDLSDYQTGTGWMPIGHIISSSDFRTFKGHFDGDYKKITGLYINNPNRTYAGLFGVTQNAVIKNLTVEDAHLILGNAAGVLIGYTYSTNIINCHVSGTIEAVSVAGGLAGGIGDTHVTDCTASVDVNCSQTGNQCSAGGLIGFFTSTSNDLPNFLTNCSASGNVTGAGHQVGGLVGLGQLFGSILKDCYFTGNVTGSNSVGGIVGSINHGFSIINCYTTGEVHGNNYVAGIVGSSSNNSEVTSCYSTGSITGASALGGILGYSEQSYYTDGCVINNCYSISAIEATGGTAGGLAGRMYFGQINNSAALNPSVKGPGDYTGRVVARNETAVILSNNIAFDGILNIAGDTIWANMGANNKDGENMSKIAINTEGTLGGRFTAANGWTTANGMLPGFGAPVEMPEHLRLEGIPPTITTENLPNGTVGVVYNQALTATGDDPITWSLESGNLPNGLALSATTGAISGTPTVDGNFCFTVKATNNAGSDEKEFCIFIEKENGINNIPQSSALTGYVQNGVLYIKGLIPGEKWEIYNITGALVYENMASCEVETWHAASLQSGIYIVKSGSRHLKIKL
jgi:hypothetical protein